MDWIDPQVEMMHDIWTGEDLFQFPHNYFEYELNEHCGNGGVTVETDSQRALCSDSLIHTLSETAHSNEQVSLSLNDEELINSNELNSENVRTDNSFVVDSNFSESMFQLSCFGTNSAESLSPTEFNDSETEWLTPACESSNLKKTKLEWTEHDGKIGIGKHSSAESRRSYCLGNSSSKNAIAARDNRLKKKKYMSDLEETVRNLQVENERLREQSKEESRTLCVLQNEVSYLRKVIANQSTLSAILKNVMKTPGIRLTTSFNSTTMHCNSPKEGRMAPDDSSCDTDCCNVKVKGFKNRRMAPDDSSYDRTHNVKGFQNNDFPSVDSHHEQVKSRSSRKVSKRNVKRKMHTHSQKNDGGYAQEIKQLTAVDVKTKTYDDSDGSNVSTDNFRGGVCLHVTGQNVSLEFCSHCHKNAYLGIFSDHSYVKL